MEHLSVCAVLPTGEDDLQWVHLDRSLGRGEPFGEL